MNNPVTYTRDYIREWALSLEYFDSKQQTEKFKLENTWPGKRTDAINDLDINYANIVLPQICNIAKSCFGASHNLEVRSCFQLTTKEDGDSWVHIDNDVKIAAVLYLTPNAPVDCGTTLYSKEEPHVPIDVIGNVKWTILKKGVAKNSSCRFSRGEGALSDGQVIFGADAQMLDGCLFFGLHVGKFLKVQVP